MAHYQCNGLFVEHLLWARPDSVWRARSWLGCSLPPEARRARWLFLQLRAVGTWGEAEAGLRGSGKFLLRRKLQRGLQGERLRQRPQVKSQSGQPRPPSSSQGESDGEARRPRSGPLRTPGLTRPPVSSSS